MTSRLSRRRSRSMQRRGMQRRNATGRTMQSEQRRRYSALGVTGKAPQTSLERMRGLRSKVEILEENRICSFNPHGVRSANNGNVAARVLASNRSLRSHARSVHLNKTNANRCLRMFEQTLESDDILREDAGVLNEVGALISTAPTSSEAS